jgi:hypothetical protein
MRQNNSRNHTVRVKTGVNYDDHHANQPDLILYGGVGGSGISRTEHEK